MSTGLFADEEDGYNLDEEVEAIEETKFKLKLPNSEPDVESLDGLEDFSDEGGIEDLGGQDLGGQEPIDDKPFDDEPFEAGVEADEESDPKTYIQQLSGKLGQSLRAYSDQQGQPDFDLEKFAVNSVLSATHTGQMDNEDQSDIIKKVKSSGNDGGDIDVNVDVDTDGGEDNVDVNTTDNEKNNSEFDEVTEESVDLGITYDKNEFDVNDTKHYYEADVIRNSDNLKGKVIRFEKGKLKIKITDGEHIGKIFYALPSEVTIDENVNFKLGEGKTPTDILEKSKKKPIFVDKDNSMNKINESTEVEPTTKPTTKPKTEPNVKPSRRQRPFRPTIQPKVEPKANDNGVIHEGEGIHGKIIDTKYLDDKIAIVKVSLDDNEVDIKFHNTGECVEKPLEYDEPWIYTYESVNSPDEKTYVVGVEFFGHPETNLELSGISDTYIENK